MSGIAIETRENRLAEIRRTLDVRASIGLSVALMLHAIAIAAVVASARSTVYLYPEPALAALAGSTFALLAAILLRPLPWQVRGVLGLAIIVAVLAGTWAFADVQEFFRADYVRRQGIGPWHHTMLFGWMSGSSFLGWSVAVISVAVFAIIAGNFSWEKLSQFFQIKLNPHRSFLIGMAMFLFVATWAQTMLLQENWWRNHLVWRWMSLLVLEAIYVVALSLNLYRTRTIRLALTGVVLGLFANLVTLWIVPNNWPGTDWELQVLGRVLLHCCVALTLLFTAIALLLRPILFHDSNKSRLPGALSIQLVVLPVLLFGFVAADFVLRADCGILLRDRSWPLATTVATLRRERVMLAYFNGTPELTLTPHVKLDIVEHVFKVMSGVNVRGTIRFEIRGMHPGIDLSFLDLNSPTYATRIWHWQIYGGTVSTAQIQAMGQGNRSVEFVRTSIVRSEKISKVVLTRQAIFFGSLEQASNLRECIDLEKSREPKWTIDREPVEH